MLCALHVPVPQQLSCCLLYLARNSDLVPWVHQVYNAVTQKLLHMVNICMYNQKTVPLNCSNALLLHIFFMCVFSEDQYLLWASFSPPSNPCLKTGLLFTPRGSSRPGTEQLWSHRAVSFRISSLSDHQQRSEDPKLKLHLFTICCLCIFSSSLSILSGW